MKDDVEMFWTVILESGNSQVVAGWLAGFQGPIQANTEPDSGPCLLPSEPPDCCQTDYGSPAHTLIRLLSM